MLVCGTAENERSRKTGAALVHARKRLGARLIAAILVRIFKGLANSDSEMRRLESCHLRRPVHLQRVTYEGCLKTERHREVSVV